MPQRVMSDAAMRAQTASAMSCLLMAFVSTAVHADEDSLLMHEGILDITGALHESPCILDMASAFQTVELNTVSREQLQRPGDAAKPVAFQLRFLDCRRTSGSLMDERKGTLLWSAYQPVLSASFLAPADSDDPRLIKVQGITGIGLRLTDERGRDVRLGSWGQALFLANGSDILTWYIHPTRTTAPLTNGAFRAVADFRLEYE